MKPFSQGQVSRRRRIAALRKRVAHQRHKLVESGSGWLFPLVGLAAGLTVPLTTKSVSPNPLANLLAAARRALGRAVQMSFVTAVLRVFTRQADSRNANRGS